jgi:hypothetical protein
MRNTTLFLPGFSHRLMGSRGRTQALHLGEESLDGLAKVVTRFIPQRWFAGEGKRQRVYTPFVTFCAFLGQVLQRDASCREAVRRVQAWCHALDLPEPDDSTSGYCQARLRLSLKCLSQVHESLVQKLSRRVGEADLWRGRCVKVIDGCGISMPDTDANRQVYPYAGGQKPGCGFPTGKLVGLFSLSGGSLIRFVQASWKTHELKLARQLVGWLRPREVLLGDRGSCGWGLIAVLKTKGVDVVLRLHQCRPSGHGRTFWRRPQRLAGWTEELWGTLPEQIEVRLVTFQVANAGFRTRTVTLATTLLDETDYPDEALIALYRRRWEVENDFRDLKATLGLDVLRTRTPKMIEREVLMQAIAYNLVCAILQDSARTHGVPLDRLSFKGTLAALRHWAPLLMKASARRQRIIYESILLALASDLVPLRPDRSEPRAVKRRPKVYQLLTKPRRQMVVSASRDLKK